MNLKKDIHYWYMYIQKIHISGDGNVIIIWLKVNYSKNQIQPTES